MPRDEPASDGEPERSGIVGYLRGVAGWLHDLHRGYAYSGHLPRRWE